MVAPDDSQSMAGSNNSQLLKKRFASHPLNFDAIVATAGKKLSIEIDSIVNSDSIDNNEELKEPMRERQV